MTGAGGTEPTAELRATERRYRLRFQLEEIDLRQPTVTIGRDESCDIVLDDSLVSRQHARLVVGPEGAVVVDLESRNGVRVNGERIRAPRALAPGDRIRLGTTDMVFCTVERIGKNWSRATGALGLCDVCKTPYVREAVSCPRCGADAFGAEEVSTAEVELPGAERP